MAVLMRRPIHDEIDERDLCFVVTYPDAEVEHPPLTQAELRLLAERAAMRRGHAPPRGRGVERRSP